MQFINTTGNTINLSDINKIISYIGDQSQYIDADLIKKSKLFQKLVLGSPPAFFITDAGPDRIEQNLFRLQNTLDLTVSANPVKCIFKAHVAGNTGYSKANRNLFFALAAQGVELYLKAVQGTECTEQHRLQRFENIPHPDSILIHSCIPSFAEPHDAKYSILYTTIESSSVPKQFIKNCDHYNEVWVTSDFSKNTLLSAGLQKPIYVIPNSVDSNRYNENTKPHTFIPALKEFKFISVLSWTYRKGFDVLLQAYLKEFSANDPVSLLLITPYTFSPDGKRKFETDNSIRQQIETHTETSHAHIARCGFNVPEDEMPRIYKACDAFVLPTRGEGFCLPIAEASLCGLPIITTNYSGHTMFVKHDNAYLVEIDKLSPLADGQTNVHYWDNEVFPDLLDDSVIDGFRRNMRYVFENNKEARHRNLLLQNELLSNYSCEIVGAMAKSRLEQIWKQIQ